jgi:hypothetical protein
MPRPIEAAKATQGIPPELEKISCESRLTPFFCLSHLLQGGAARLARQAHNLKVVGSNPTPAPNFKLLVFSMLHS